MEYDESESVWSSQSDYFDEFSYSITVKPADVDSKAEKLKDVIEKRGEASGSGWTKKLFGIDALHAETLHCPNCSEEFDKDSWIPHDGFHSATSPKWSYACPSDSCQTLFIFDRTE